MFREVCRRGAEVRGWGLGALFQNGTFVILRRAVACRILVLEETPP